MAWHACTCILTLRASITPLVNLSGTAAHYWFCWISALSGWNNYLCRQGRHAGSIMCPLSPVWSRWGGGPGQHWTIMLLLGLYNKNFNCKNKAIWTPNFEKFIFENHCTVNPSPFWIREKAHFVSEGGRIAEFVPFTVLQSEGVNVLFPLHKKILGRFAASV